MSSSEEPKKDDYSARLAELKVFFNESNDLYLYRLECRDQQTCQKSVVKQWRVDHTIKQSVSRNWIKTRLIWSIEKAKEKINTDVYAQRIVINELVSAYQTRSKKVNDVIAEFKRFTKENTKIVSFYLFMAEIYRLNKHIDGVSFSSRWFDQ